LAVKIVRQPKKIALIGAPSSAAAFSPGTEKGPAALRAAGIIDRLKGAGFEVVDHGDCAPRHFADDEEHRRARNLPEIVAGLNDLKTRAEIAIKSGAFVLVLGGECVQVMGLLTAARRYYKHINLLWLDSDADLNTPATTPSGRIDGMVVAHIIGKGAPELVRFWGEPPLVREPDVTLFSVTRLDPPEQEFLSRSPLRHIEASHIQAKGIPAAAAEALAHLHADSREFVLHLDLDVIAQEDFPAVYMPASGGLRFDEVRAALAEFVRHKNLLGLDVAEYNPDKDPDGTCAKKIIDLLVEALSARLEAPAAPQSSASEPASASAASEAPSSVSSGSPTSSSPTSEPATQSPASAAQSAGSATQAANSALQSAGETAASENAADTAAGASSSS
jgi:arginase